MRQHSVIGGEERISNPSLDRSIRSTQHTDIGNQILSTGSSPLLRMAASIAYSHHEKWDGPGYPQRLQGEQIPLAARITAVADVFDALSSQRPYKKAIAPDECCAIMRRERGRHFDPTVLDAFFARQADVLAVYCEFGDHEPPHGAPTPMNVLLASPHGFCAGVVRAMRALEQALECWGPPLFVYHEIVHNKHVVRHFEQQGVVFVNCLEEVPDGSLLLFSAHGVSPEIRARRKVACRLWTPLARSSRRCTRKPSAWHEAVTQLS